MPIRDFYMRREDDPKFRPDQCEVYDETEALINQVTMTLFTNKTEVLGELDYGLQIERFLFDFNVDAALLGEVANYQIHTYVSLSKKFDITVLPERILDRSGRDVLILNIGIGGLTKFSVLYD